MGDAIVSSHPGQQPGSTTVKQRDQKTPGESAPANGTASIDAKHFSTQPTALQQHVLFWDRDNDGIIHPWDVYTGFRELGFNIPFSIGSLLIPIFFSYPTGLARSWFPAPLFRIYVGSIHKAKHGSDSGIFDLDGHFHAERFEAMFERWDVDRCGGLSAEQMWAMWKKNRLAADVAGWCFAFMELWTTWLLLQKDGRVWKDDLRACYDGTLFWKISELVQKGQWNQGYGVGDFIDGMLNGGTWRNWELENQQNGKRST